MLIYGVIGFLCPSGWMSHPGRSLVLIVSASELILPLPSCFPLLVQWAVPQGTPLQGATVPFPAQLKSLKQEFSPTLSNSPFQLLLCFQHCSPLQSSPTTIDSPSAASPLKGLYRLQMQIESSGVYQLYGKKKRKINPLWRLGDAWTGSYWKESKLRKNCGTGEGDPELISRRVASLAILINFRGQLPLWIDNWTVFWVWFWLIYCRGWVSLRRKMWGREHACIGKCVSVLTQPHKVFPFALLKSNSHHLCSSFTSLCLSWRRDLLGLGTFPSWVHLM